LTLKRQQQATQGNIATQFSSSGISKNSSFIPSPYALHFKSQALRSLQDSSAPAD
jgi:hypothetical protein